MLKNIFFKDMILVVWNPDSKNYIFLKKFLVVWKYAEMNQNTFLTNPVCKYAQMHQNTFLTTPDV
jgi:alanine dehydrogenase